MGGFESILSSLFGGAAGMGGMGGRQRRGGSGYRTSGFAYPPEKGTDLETSVDIEFLESVHGTKRTIRIDNGQRHEDVTIKIPAGTSSGTKMRVAGKGQDGEGGSGDLYVVVNVRPHASYRREGNDIIGPVRLAVSDALLGCSRDVETPSGSKRIKIPAGVSSSTKIRLKGLGFPGRQGSDAGDFYAEVMIEIPKSLSDEQRTIAERMRELGL